MCIIRIDIERQANLEGHVYNQDRHRYQANREGHVYNHDRYWRQILSAKPTMKVISVYNQDSYKRQILNA